MGMMSSIEDSMFDAVKAITGYDDNHIIWANRNVPEPNGTHVAMRHVHLNPMSGSNISTLVQDGKQRTFQDHEWYLQFTFVGDNAADDVMEFASRLNSPYLTEEFTKRNISFLRKTHARSVPKMRETEYVQCWNMECFFLVNIENKIDTPWMEEIKYTASYPPSSVTNTRTIP